MQPPRSPVLALLSIASLVAAIALWPVPARQRAACPPGPERADVARATGGRVVAAPRTPPTFVPNRGQWDERVRFAARSGAMTAWFTDTGWTLAVEQQVRQSRWVDGGEDRRRGAAVRMELVGATPGRAPRGEAVAAGRSLPPPAAPCSSVTTRWTPATCS